MNSLSYNRGELLKIRKENRGKHKKEYDKALPKYWSELRKAFQGKIKELKKKDLGMNLYINLPQPREYLSEYDTTIRMLEMTTLLEVELSSHDFERFVMDEWEWKENFSNSTSIYNAARK